MDEEKSTSREVEIRLTDLWEVFLRCWWVMAAVLIVVGAGVFLFLNVTHVDAYTATASIYVMREKDASQSVTSTADVSISNNIIKDCLLLAQTDRVLEAVCADSDLMLTTSALSRMISVGNEEETHFVYISVTAPDAEHAQQLTDSVADEICDTFNNYIFEGESYVKVLDRAKVPTHPSNPISKIKVLLIAVVCALLVYAVYFVMFLLDDKINTQDDVQEYLGLSLLGQIPNKQDAGRRKKYYAEYGNAQFK